MVGLEVEGRGRGRGRMTLVVVVVDKGWMVVLRGRRGSLELEPIGLSAAAVDLSMR